MTGITRPRHLDELTDEQVVEQVRQGNDLALEHLLQRYQRFARAKARGYFLIGADADDVYQEGMIGLFKAIRDYRDDRQASFRAFAELCITRQIITAIKTATRQKHQPLNSYVSFSMPCGDDSNDRTAEEILVGGDEKLDPEHQVISMEGIHSLAGSLNEILSNLELQVLRLYVEGLSYVDIAERLGRHAKSIDNAIQRIKRKLEAHLEKRAEEDTDLEEAV
ncbi:MAG: RNA polymerase sporulation sigma factor SigH [Acidimicrobiia bacterium]|nr:RNA polymerase sporulation sigma factor SigH [Acidimicrobiia bacterium]